MWDGVGWSMRGPALFCFLCSMFGIAAYNVVFSEMMGIVMGIDGTVQHCYPASE